MVDIGIEVKMMLPNYPSLCNPIFISACPCILPGKMSLYTGTSIAYPFKLNIRVRHETITLLGPDCMLFPNNLHPEPFKALSPAEYS